MSSLPTRSASFPQLFCCEWGLPCCRHNMQGKTRRSSLQMPPVTAEIEKMASELPEEAIGAPMEKLLKGGCFVWTMTYAAAHGLGPQEGWRV